VDVLEAIKTRRSVRRYQRNPVPDELVRELLEAGRWAPSSKNSQPWRFIVLRSGEVRERIARVAAYGWFLADAPLGIVVAVDPKASRRAIQDGSNAAMLILLAAHALGLGACWIASYDTPHEEEVREILGVPEGVRIAAIISIGYPAERPVGRRKELSEIAFVDTYGKKWIES